MDHDGNPRMSRDEGGASANAPAALYRLNSNQSSSSVFEDVEMAHDEVPILFPRS
jgi:cation-transporting ATPase 13A3/4/5